MANARMEPGACMARTTVFAGMGDYTGGHHMTVRTVKYTEYGFAGVPDRSERMPSEPKRRQKNPEPCPAEIGFEFQTIAVRKLDQLGFVYWEWLISSTVRDKLDRACDAGNAGKATRKDGDMHFLQAHRLR